MSGDENALCKLKNVFVSADDFLENNYFDDDDPGDKSVSGTSIWFLIIFMFYNFLFIYLVCTSLVIYFVLWMITKKYHGS